MILVTGGAGYIGSHTCVELAAQGREFIILDNLCNSSAMALQRIEQLIGKHVHFVNADIRDSKVLKNVIVENQVTDVIHFAGLKAVGESCQKPLEYYENNVSGSVNLFQVMADCGVKNLIFSSSATVYGDPEKLPITEDMPLSATNPYGRSKLMIEEILRDLYSSNPEWNIALLRYFNPAGAHPSGLIGEDPAGIPNNLMPFITQVAIGKLQELAVFGGDYPTPDGTGVRDYIHVVDLAKGHVKALQKLQDNPGIQAWNLGLGNGYSVLEMIEVFKRITGKPVPYKIAARRAGDIAACYADVSKSSADLGWQSELGLEEMVRDAWNWQSHNPNGYDN